MQTLSDLLASAFSAPVASSFSGKVYRIDDLAFKRVKRATEFRPLTAAEWLEWSDEDGGFYMVCTWATDGRSSVTGVIYRVEGEVPAADLRRKPKA